MIRLSSHRRVFASLLVLGSLLSAQPVVAAPFVNLDFEQATVPPGTPSPGFIPTALAFPGWTARMDGVPLTTVYYNHFGIGEGAVALYDVPVLGLGLPVFEGSYSAALVGNFSTQARYSLAQIGDVPLGTMSLRFLADFDTPPVLSLNGIETPLTLITFGSTSQGSLFGADIASFAGQNMELRFKNTIPPNGIVSGVDGIEFSPQPIPEPSHGVALMILIPLLLRHCRSIYVQGRKSDESSSTTSRCVSD